MTEPSPGIVAFLAAKIVDSEGLADDVLFDREALLRRAAMRVQQEIDASGGKILTAGGGQLVVTFERPASAVMAAIALGAAFPSPGRADDSPAVDIHLTLHVGAAAHAQPGAASPILAYLGQLLFVSRPGQILVSDALARLLRASPAELPASVSVRGVGLLNLRDGSDPTRVFQVIITRNATLGQAVAEGLPASIPIRRKRQVSQSPPRRRAGADPEPFRVYTLGRFRVLRGAMEVELSNSQGLKGLQLFKCLLTRPSQRLPRDQAYELFWPDSPKSKVNTTFRTNVKRLRDLLEPDVDAQASILQYTPEIVSIRAEPTVWVDADEFERLIQEARHAEAPRPLLEEADRLWQGEFLPDDLYHDWSAPRRAELARLWTELQVELARLRERHGDEHGAEAALQKLLAADPTDEQAARELMLLHGRHGRRSDALKVYQRLEEALARELRMEPTAETQAVRRRVTAGEITPAAPSAQDGGLAPFPWPAGSPANPPATHPPATHPPGNLPDGQEEATRPDASTASALNGRRAQTGQPIHEPIQPAMPSAAAISTTPVTPPAPLTPLRPNGRPDQRADSPTTWPTLPPVSSEAESFTPTYPFPTPGSLVGRQADLLTARQSLQRGLSEGQTLLIGASAGSGKSALAGLIVAEARAQGYLCLAGGSFDQDSPSPYAPIRDALCDYLLAQPADLLRAELGHLATDLTPIVPELRYHLNDGGESPVGAPDQPRLLAAVHGCLRVLAMRTPTLLCLEDLHAADGATLEMLHYLARQTRRLRLVIVGTFRPEEVQPGRPLDRLLSAARRDGSAHVILLPPLTRDETQALIAERLTGAVSEVLTDALFTVTEGNPLFIEQLALALREEQGIVQRDGVWYRVGGESASTPALPPVVESVIERRFDRLPPGGRDTLAMAAVLGQTFDLPTLLAALPPADAAGAVAVLDNAIDAQLLRDTATGYRFGHAMIREALYRRLSGPRRAMLHARAGAVIEEAAGERADERAAELAHHFALAATVAPTAEKALRFCLLAGRRAAALSAHRDALRHYTRAHDLLAARGAQDGQTREAQQAQHIEVLQGRGKAQQDLGLWQDAIATFRQVLSLTDDPYRCARAYSAVGRGLEQISDFSGALTAYQSGLAVLAPVAEQPEAVNLELALLYDTAFPNLWQGRFLTALDVAGRILAGGRRLGQPVQLFRGNCATALALMRMGRVAPAIVHYQEALQAAEQHGDKILIASGNENYGTQLYLAGRFDEARVHIERAAAFYRDAAGERRTVLARQRLCRIYLALGNLELALHHGERGRVLALEVGDRHAAECNAALGAVHTERAAWDDAERCLSLALEVQQRVGHLLSSTDSLVSLGLVQERRGEWARAEASYRAAVALTMSMDPGILTVASARHLGRLLLRKGDHQAATAEIERAAALAEQIPETLEFAPTLLVRAELRAPDDLAAARQDTERALSAPMTAELAVEARALAVAFAVEAGDCATAAGHMAALTPAAVSPGAPLGLGLAQLAAGQLAAAQGARDAAHAAFEAALGIFTAAGLPYERAMTLLQLSATRDDEAGVDASQMLRAEADELLQRLRAVP